ncbi:MAG: GNAT family N-acetyltransferase [Acidobacteria bacterium]|nr:GNAT family N-acetyltransferase [Acidobacteriota bacterium]
MRDPSAVVRFATDADLPAIDALLASRPATYRGSGDLAVLVGDADGRWLVAQVAGETVGAARLVLDRPPRPTVLCVVVHPDARELGIGASLVDEIRRIARSGGHDRIDALALPGDRETKNLFERAGLTARLIVASGDA